MQLKQLKQFTKTNKTIYQGLAIATCSLLSNVPQNSHAHDVEGKDLDYSTSFLDYVEKGRVKIREINQTVKWQMNDDITLSGSFTFDSITGSTPTGALKNNNNAAAQTSTTASGTSSGTGFGGGGSQNAKFLDALAPIVDRRVAVGGQIEQALDRNSRYKAGALFSREDDYTSYGLTGSYVMELNNKLLTLEAGVGLSYDIIDPIDGSPAPDRLTNVNSTFALENGEKSTYDFSFTATQILNHRTIAKAGFTTGIVKGYLSDPYKVVTLRNEISGLAEAYFFERRPDSRFRNALLLDVTHQPFENDVIYAGYQFFWDDWSIQSHKIDLRYRWGFGRSYLMPHFRFYHQSAANFYREFLDRGNGENPDAVGTPSGINAPAYASADTRLDKLNTLTLGIKYGIEGALGHFRMRWELMHQNGSAGQFKVLNARIFQISWTLNLQ